MTTSKILVSSAILTLVLTSVSACAQNISSSVTNTSAQATIQVTIQENTVQVDHFVPVVSTVPAMTGYV